MNIEPFLWTLLAVIVLAYYGKEKDNDAMIVGAYLAGFIAVIVYLVLVTYHNRIEGKAWQEIKKTSVVVEIKKGMFHSDTCWVGQDGIRRWP